MQHGDLSNKVSPRLGLVFEGALGFCTDRPKFDKAMNKGKYEAAMEYWELNQLAARHIEWLCYRKDVNLEVITFFGPEFATELGYWLDSLPLHRVWATTPEELGRKVAYMNDLYCIYDPEPARWLYYGDKGRYLTSVSQIGEGM